MSRHLAPWLRGVGLVSVFVFIGAFLLPEGYVWTGFGLLAGTLALAIVFTVRSFGRVAAPLADAASRPAVSLRPADGARRGAGLRQ